MIHHNTSRGVAGFSVKSSLFSTLLLLLSGIGAYSILYSTSVGIGLSPDSTVYLGVANSLISGYGFYIPLTEIPPVSPMVDYPPFYPLLLASVKELNISPMVSTRWFDAISFSLLILIAGSILYRITDGAFFTSILGAFLLASSNALISIHTWAWTEPLFNVAGFLGLLFLSFHLEKPRTIHLLAGSICISICFLLRYAGLAFVIDVIFGLFFFSRQALIKRITDGIIFLFLTVTPMMAWMVRNRIVSGAPMSRKFIFHPFGITNLNQTYETIRHWLIPINDPDLQSKVFIVFFILIAIFILIYIASNVFGSSLQKRRNSFGPPVIVKLLGGFLVIYTGFLVISISFFNAFVPMDDRILSPALISGIILSVWIGNETVNRLSLPAIIHHLLYLFLFAFGLFISYFQLTKDISWVSYYHKEGLGYNNRTWQNSETIAAVKGLPPDTLIYTNAPDVIYTLTERPSKWLPNKVDPVSTIQYNDYKNNLLKIGSQLSQHSGVIVYFNNIHRDYLPDDKELAALPNLQKDRETSDGVIFISNH
jgi:hypothetical protein